MTDGELEAIEARANGKRRDYSAVDGCFYCDGSNGRNPFCGEHGDEALQRLEVLDLVREVRLLQHERAELRELAKKVRDYWRANPGHTKDGISTPGMMLLMAVEKP